MTPPQPSAAPDALKRADPDALKRAASASTSTTTHTPHRILTTPLISADPHALEAKSEASHADPPRASQDLDAFVTRRSNRIPSDRRYNSTAPIIPTVPPPAHGLDVALLDAVVMIFTTHCEPNQGLPWQMGPQYDTSATAFILPRQRLLTNAHAVSFHTVVRVKKRTSDVKFIARVLAIGEECDLALLTVDDPTFWANTTPLKFGPLPMLHDPVVVIGYPLGGENISVTAGVTSRIDLRPFSSANDFLTIQIDAAINPGNSGGPALNAINEVVGVAFEKLASSDNIGFLIAGSVVGHFLEDVDRNGTYQGSCICGFRWQTLADPTIRRYLKMDPDDTGILVLSVDNTSDVKRVLQKDDIVTAVDDVMISNAGTVPHSSGERILFHSILLSKFVGDSLSLSLIRDGERMDVRYEVPNCLENDIVPAHSGQMEPDYFIIAGMVFVVLTEPYMRHQYGPGWSRQAPIHLMQLWQHGVDNEHDGEIEHIVLVSQVLNAEINVEYSHVVDERVHRINGVQVRNLRHLSNLCINSDDEFLRFDLEWEVVVLDREKALASNKRILDQHHIPTVSRLSIHEEEDEDS